MKIQVIAEGFTPEQRVRGEWGLAMLINDSILFDTFGHPEMLEKNIRHYGVDLRKVKKAIISHNHWDHVSGLNFVLKNAKQPAVYLPQEDMKIYELCRRHGAYVHVADEKGGVKDGFMLTGALKASLKGDTFMEQGAVFEGKRGPVLIAGCSHPGILKMVKRAEKLMQKPVFAVIGGLHLKDSPDKKILKIVQALRKLGVKKIYAGHCTGDKACKILKKKFGVNFRKIKQGSVYVF